MSKIVVNENPQGPAPPAAPAAPLPAGEVAQDVAKVITILFVLAIAGGVGLLLYHYWKFALAILLAMVVFACGASRVALIGFMCVLLVALAILNSVRAQTVVDGDTIKLGGTTRDEPSLCRWLDGRQRGVQPKPTKNTTFDKAWFAAMEFFDDDAKRISFGWRMMYVLPVAMGTKYTKYVDVDAGTQHVALLGALATVRGSYRATKRRCAPPSTPNSVAF
jgi:hypothetical protein